MTNPLAIFGAGGLGREVLALVQSLKEWHVVGFFDDMVKRGTKVYEVEVLGDRTVLLNWPERLHVVLAMGSPSQKKEVISFLKDAMNLSYPTLIHPRATIMKPDCVTLGEGTILTAGCIVTADIQIGRHVLVNLNATIGHNSMIGDFSSIMPGVNLAGGVKLGEAVLVGSGANILNAIEVGSSAIIGAGAVVNHHVGQHETAVGVPARAIIKKL